MIWRCQNLEIIFAQKIKNAVHHHITVVIVSPEISKIGKTRFLLKTKRFLLLFHIPSLKLNAEKYNYNGINKSVWFSSASLS
jgi:hypothetical protein